MGDPTWSEDDERAAGELLARLLGPRNESPTMICLHNTAMACIREWATAERARVAGERGAAAKLARGAAKVVHEWKLGTDGRIVGIPLVRAMDALMAIVIPDPGDRECPVSVSGRHDSTGTNNAGELECLLCGAAIGSAGGQ